ncbi:hypothetical protein [Flavobacterium sp. T12S277]|uniref:hypothetical protein n=1 Tax=Flavobacterium sp. T12S277 TaxID=3402752 RepID=UPI003AE3F148
MNFVNSQNCSNKGVPYVIDQVIDQKWNVVFTPAGTVCFATAEDSLDGDLKDFKEWKKRSTKIRHQFFSIHTRSLAFVCGKEKIPLQLNNPDIFTGIISYTGGIWVSKIGVIRTKTVEKVNLHFIHLKRDNQS